MFNFIPVIWLIKFFPYGVMLNFLFFFVLFTAVKTLKIYATSYGIYFLLFNLPR